MAAISGIRIATEIERNLLLRIYLGIIRYNEGVNYTSICPANRGRAYMKENVFLLRASFLMITWIIFRNRFRIEDQIA
jgi:hypothetical protein